MRDMGRAAVYEVENMVARMMERGGPVDFHGSTLNLEPDMRFGQVADMQRYVDMAWPTVGVGPAPRIVQSRGRQRAYYATASHTIHVPDRRVFRTRLLLLHEIAHAVVRVSGDRDPGHGEAWRKTYCWILEQCGMPEVSLLIRSGFDADAAA